MTIICDSITDAIWI